MRYAKGVLITFVAKGLAIPIGVASSIVTARYLGPEGRGVLAILITLQTMAIQFGAVGFNASITYFIARDKNLTAPVASNALVVASSLGSALAVLFVVVGIVSPTLLIGSINPIYLYIFAVSVPFSFLPQFFQNIFIAYQDFYRFNVLDLFSRLLQLAGFILLLPLLHFGTFETAEWFVAVTLVSGLVYLSQASRTAKISFRFQRSLFGEMFQYGVKSYLAGIFLFLVTRSNLFLINYFLGSGESGIYSVVLQFMDVIYLLPATLGLILFPIVSANVGDRGELTSKVFRFSLVVMAAVCGVLLIAGRPMISLMFGEKFAGAVQPLYWLTPGILALSLSNIILNDLAGRGLPGIVITAPAIGFVGNILVTLLLMNSYGIRAAAIGSTVAYLMMFVILFSYFVNKMEIRATQLLVPKLSDFTSIK